VGGDRETRDRRPLKITRVKKEMDFEEKYEINGLDMKKKVEKESVRLQ
jgi:hypothetical protein